MKVISYIKKIISGLWVLRSIFKTIYLNLKCLPLNQAIHLPILLYKAELISLKGKIIINSPVRYGMIKLGIRIVSIYDNSGIMIENNGTIIFNGECVMGNGTKISVGSTGVLEIGHNFTATSGNKIACYDKIKFGDNVLVGWECLFIDTDFHQLSTIQNEIIKAYAPIMIGNNCWFACRNMVMKGCILPSWSVVAANSLLNRDYSYENERTLFAGQPAKVIKSGVYLDITDEKNSTIKYK